MNILIFRCFIQILGIVGHEMAAKILPWFFFFLEITFFVLVGFKFLFFSICVYVNYLIIVLVLLPIFDDQTYIESRGLPFTYGSIRGYQLWSTLFGIVDSNLELSLYQCRVNDARSVP